MVLIMKIKILSILFIILFATHFSYGQANQNVAKEIIMPMVVVADLHFALEALNKIEITGNQVNAFLDIKNLFSGAIEYANNNGLKMSDAFKISTTYAVGKNTLFFLEKVTLTGANAENYKRLTSAFEVEFQRLENSKKNEQPSE